MDLDQELRETYADRLGELDLPGGDVAGARRAGARLRTHRRLAAGVAAVAVVAVAVAGTLLGTGRVSIQPSHAVGHWRELPTPPLSPRADALTVWTGREVVVLGGDTNPCPPNASCASDPGGLRDGAAYQPTTDTWRAIPPAPVPVGPGDRLVVADGVVVLRHWRPGAAAWFTYEPDHNRWSRIAGVPQRAGDLPSALGSRVYVTAGRRVAVYDVRRFTWSLLPPDPIRPALTQRRVTATSAGPVVTGYDATQANDGRSPSVTLAHVWDGTGWHRLPATGQLGNEWTWNGSHLVDPDPTVEDGGETNPFPHEFPVGGVLDPRTGQWSPLPAAVTVDPGNGWGVYAAGPRRFATYGQVYDSRTGDVVRLPRPDGAPLDGAAASWAGDRLLAFGGVSYRPELTTGRLTNRAWIYTP